MSARFLFALLGGLIVLAFAANRLFQRTRVPDVIVLMATGVLLGPVLHVVHAELFQPVARVFGILALILILFEGGLDLDVRDTLRHFPAGLLVSALSYGWSLGLVSAVIVWSLKLPASTAILAGAALACTSSSIALPILQQIEVSKPVRLTLMFDATMSDTFGVLTVGALLNLAQSHGSVVTEFLHHFLFTIFLSLLSAGLAALVWSFVLPFLSGRRFWNVLTFAVVLLVYAAVEQLGGSGLIAVFFFGIGLTNLQRVDTGMLEESFGLATLNHHQQSQISAFHSELAFVIRTFFFVLIGVVVDFSALARHLPLVLGVVGAIILARALALLSSRWALGGIPPRDRETIFWIMPRGLITVVLALEIVGRQQGNPEFLPGLAFATILATSLLLIAGSIRAPRAPAPVEAASAQPPPAER
jgi:Na+:H+ antiporter